MYHDPKNSIWLLLSSSLSPLKLYDLSAKVAAIKLSGKHFPNFEKNIGGVLISSFFKYWSWSFTDLCFISYMNAIIESISNLESELNGLILTDL